MIALWTFRLICSSPNLVANFVGADQRREKLAQNELRLNGYVRFELFERTLLGLNPTRLRPTSLEPERVI